MFEDVPGLGSIGYQRRGQLVAADAAPAADVAVQPFQARKLNWPKVESITFGYGLDTHHALTGQPVKIECVSCGKDGHWALEVEMEMRRRLRYDGFWEWVWG